jgi:hypothetical protein
MIEDTLSEYKQELKTFKRLRETPYNWREYGPNVQRYQFLKALSNRGGAWLEAWILSGRGDAK